MYYTTKFFCHLHRGCELRFVVPRDLLRTQEPLIDMQACPFLSPFASETWYCTANSTARHSTPRPSAFDLYLKVITSHFPVTTDIMRISLLTPSLTLLALAKPSQGTPTPAPKHYLTVSVVSILGSPEHAHRLGPGYIPTSFIGKTLRFAYSGDDWDRQCMEASGGDTTNGKLVRITGNCVLWQKSALWSWDVKGQIT